MSKRRSGRNGFALIIVLMMMILLAVLALGLLTLSSVELRNSSRSAAQGIARANARVALMMACARIQRELGPDQRISAVSGILESSGSGASVKHPYLTGVWNSRQEPLGTTPDYDHSKAFRGWLVSNATPESSATADFAKSGVFTDPIEMVTARSAGGSPVHAGRIPVSTGANGLESSLAWWVSDENCKGFAVPTDSLAQGTAATVPDLLAGAGTPGAYGMQALDPAYPANTPDAAKVVTHGQLALASSSGISTRDWFHGISPFSRGLLTNVKTGGLRHDLGLFLEQTPPSSWMGVGLASVKGPNGKYALSPLDDSASPSDGYDVLPWKYLYHYHRLKERVQIADGRPFLETWKGGDGVVPDDLINPRWNAGVLRPAPVLARAVIVISFGSIPNPANLSANPPEYVLRLYASPMITLWNPYNVDLKIEKNYLQYLFTSLPMNTRIQVNGAPTEEYGWRGRVNGAVAPGANNYIGAGLMPMLDEPLVLKAGEVKMLSTVSNKNSQKVPIHQLHSMQTLPFDYRNVGIWGGASSTRGAVAYDQTLVASKGTAADKVTLETVVKMWDKDGGSFIRDYPATFDIRGQHARDGADEAWPTFLWGQKIGWLYESTVPDIATPDQLSRTNKPSASFGEILDAPRPFMIVDVQLKSLDEGFLPNKTWRDCIPGHAYQGVTKGLGDATPYFANAYKLQFKSINSYAEASAYLQVAPDNSSHTYIGGGTSPASGQSWITDQEIPLAPFTSLAQLQNVPQTSCDTLYSSGLYFQNHAIGNSFASPGIPSGKVKSNGWSFCVDMYQNNTGGSINGVRYPKDQFHTRPNIDRSYAANELLWDDYFFSSMAAKNDKLRSAAQTKGLDAVVKEFFEAGKPLPNERYKPWLDASATEVSARYLGTAAATGYKSVAGNLVVDGAFNINSVSVQAWKTMLASAHKRNMIVMRESGAPAATGAKDYVVSRFSLSNDNAYSGTGPDVKWQGYHQLTEAQIGELAEAIVRQVKLRGPFRSLSEFINRRLGPESDEKTRYGALQAALEDPSVSINAKYRAPEITAADIARASYPNKSAALGPRHQGAPPYVTQADLLNSFGSIVTARSDTFLIRAYGEAKDASGNILASAWCEGVVQRLPAYMDAKDPVSALSAELTSDLNKWFGRRFHLISFRWLNRNER